MKILHLYKDYAPVLGGIEGSLQLLAEGQAARGHQVTVLVTSPSARTSKTLENGVEVMRAGRWATLASTPLSPRFVMELRRQRPNITHIHAPYPPALIAQWLCGRSHRTVLTHHSDIVRQRRLGMLYSGLQQRALGRVDRILVTSPPYLESSATLRPHRQRCTVLPLGVDVDRFRHPDPALVDDFRRQLGTPLVLFVGRLRYYKGIEYLLAAMPDVAGNLAVVGRGALEDRCHQLAAAGAASERIHFLGDVGARELAALYAAADLFVLPSIARSEAYGLVLLEAMAAGTPVISTQLGTGTSWINQDGVTGKVVAAADVEALSNALRELLAAPERLATMAMKARQRAEQLSSERMIDLTLDAYRQLL